MAVVLVAVSEGEKRTTEPGITSVTLTVSTTCTFVFRRGLEYVAASSDMPMALHLLMSRTRHPGHLLTLAQCPLWPEDLLAGSAANQWMPLMKNSPCFLHTRACSQVMMSAHLQTGIPQYLPKFFLFRVPSGLRQKAHLLPPS